MAHFMPCQSYANKLIDLMPGRKRPKRERERERKNDRKRAAGALRLFGYDAMRI